MYFLILYTGIPLPKQKDATCLIHLDEDNPNKEILSMTSVNSSLNIGGLFNAFFLVDLLLWLKTKINSCSQH